MATDEEAADAQRQFDREKAIFEQDSQEFRSLNGFLWQIPVIVSTLTGGLWFGVDKVGKESFVRPALWLLAFAVNVVFIVVLWRLRAGPMENLLDRIHAYQGVPRSGARYTMITMFTLLLLMSALISLIAFVPESGLLLRRVAQCWT